MAGKTRLAAKLLVLTGVLATGGAGAYHYTSSGAWPRLFSTGEREATATLLVDDTRSLSPTELDAVASSWAGNSAGRNGAQAADRALTTEARSADSTLARAGTVPGAALVGSRYAVPGSSTPDASPRDDERASTSGAEPAPTPAPEVQLASANDPADPAASNRTIGSVSEENTEPPLARGQEPDDLQDADGAAESENEPAEPAELESAPSELTRPIAAGADAVTRRAREAFRETPAAPADSTATSGTRVAGDAPLNDTALSGRSASTAGGRYATVPPSTATSPRGELTQPSQPASSNMVNPFASPVSAGQAAAPTTMNSAGSPQAGDDVALGSASSRLSTARDDQAIGDLRGSGQSMPLGADDRGYRSGVSTDAPFQPTAGAAVPAGNPMSYGGREASAVGGTGRPGERALEGLQKPALAIQKFGPAEIQVGKPAKFAVQVRNVGTQSVDDVVIRDEVPQGTQLISTSPQAESDGTHLVWRLGKLSVGDERTVEMQLMPTAEGEVGSVATVTHSAQASVKSRSTMPQLAIRMTAPSKVMIGSEQRVKIELRNPGSGDATGVMLFENVPPNVRHASGPALEFEVGTLPAGQTRELELVLHAEKAGKVVNVLTARADGNLQVQQQVEFEVIAPALAVAVNGPERRYLERPATYEVTVENPGTAAAHDVQLVTKLPKGMRFVRANNMGEYDAASHAVYWSLAELPEGEQGTVELVTMPIETGPQTLEVEGRAQQGLTDQAQQQIVVEGLAAIMFEVRDLEDPIEVGGETGYEIRVVNQGTKAATNVQVTVNLPTGLQVTSAEGETRHTAQGGRIVFEPLSTLAPKADTLYRIKAQGLQPGDQRVTVEVDTDDLGQPIRREESTRVFGDE